jgi:hypothetical protein
MVSCARVWTRGDAWDLDNLDTTAMLVVFMGGAKQWLERWAREDERPLLEVAVLEAFLS